MKRGIIMHELMHVLGFFHMHSAPNRDDFVWINWNNIKPEFLKNFKMSKYAVSMFGTGYDYESVMHYGSSGIIILKEKVLIFHLISLVFAELKSFAKNPSNPIIIRKSGIF